MWNYRNTAEFQSSDTEGASSTVTNSLGRTLGESAQVESNTRLSFVTAVEVYKCQGLLNTPVSGQLRSQRFVECGIQTEHIVELALTSSGVQTSPRREPSALCIVASCGVQAFPDVDDCASQVNQSLAGEHLVDAGTETAVQGRDSASQVNRSLTEGYYTHTGTQAVTQVANFMSQVDLELSRNQSTDRGVQCDIHSCNCEPQGVAAPSTTDCGMQTTQSTKDCATQMQHISHCHLIDREVQAVPHTRDGSTEPAEQRLKYELQDCGVQTGPSHSLHDKSVQSESFATHGVSREVQVSFPTGESQVDSPSTGMRCVDSAIQVSLIVTKDCSVQDDKSLAHDVSGTSASKALPFVPKSILQTSGSGGPSVTDATSSCGVLSTSAVDSNTTSTIAPVPYQRFMRPGFNIFAPIKFEEEQPPDDKSAAGGRRKFFPFRKLAFEEQAKATPISLQQRKKKVRALLCTIACIHMWPVSLHSN